MRRGCAGEFSGRGWGQALVVWAAAREPAGRLGSRILLLNRPPIEPRRDQPSPPTGDGFGERAALLPWSGIGVSCVNITFRGMLAAEGGSFISESWPITCLAYNFKNSTF